MKKIIKEWLDKAKEDLTVCEDLIDKGKFPDIAGFHAQQSAEKYLKALWEFFDIGIVKAHDLYFLKEELMEKTEKINEIDDEDLYFLTQFAVDFRYPGGEKSTMKEAMDAYRIALKVRNIVLEILEK